jgi:uncharacterized membrane protein YphA (DoxX/SURF4 family)
MTDVALLIGRLLFGGLFVYNGVNHFTSRAAIVGYCQYKKVPMPGIAAAISGLWLLIGGLLIMAGFHPHYGAAMVALFLLFVTPKMHDFWTQTDATARMGDWVNFQKNFALLGAALILLAIPGPWPYSIAP